MANVGREIELRQGGSKIVLITNGSKKVEEFNGLENALSRKKDALIFNNCLVWLKRIVAVAMVGEIVAIASGETNIALSGLALIAIGGTFLTVADRPNPELIKKQIVRIKSAIQKESSEA